MELSVVQIVAVCGTWILYGLLHSLAASLKFKHYVANHWPQYMPLYRLMFNLLASVALLPPLLLIYLWRGPYLWQWSGIGVFIANGLALLALAGFAWSLRYYDGSEFLGLRQWRERARQVEGQERFYISPLHRFVRHPWYCLGLVIIWTRDMDAVFLISSLMMTGYFVVGSRLEELKLMVYHGDRYRAYRDRVPALLPLPWRYLRKSEAEELMRE
jgi:protein-S-isoprenylcysteine O-methyltransferase Ste14